MENFKYEVKIPVPIGHVVWTFDTDCCDACSVKRNEKFKCSMYAPCHTKQSGTKPVVLTLDNLGEIIRNWNEKYFETEIEAKIKCISLTEEHKSEMKKLGFQISENGELVKEIPAE